MPNYNKNNHKELFFSFISSYISKLLAKNNQNNIAIAITGPICSGKSYIANELKDFIVQKIAMQSYIVPTDGFIYPTQYLIDHNLLEKKGYPESYDHEYLYKIYTDVLNNTKNIDIPLYSHLKYDRDSHNITIHSPSILIFDGINLLQPIYITNKQRIKMKFDLTIYVDVDNEILIKWFLERKTQLFFNKDECSFTQFKEQMLNIWYNINYPNNNLNILPYKNDADIIIKIDNKHQIQNIINKVLEIDHLY